MTPEWSKALQSSLVKRAPTEGRVVKYTELRPGMFLVGRNKRDIFAPCYFIEVNGDGQDKLYPHKLRYVDSGRVANDTWNGRHEPTWLVIDHEAESNEYGEVAP